MKIVFACPTCRQQTHIDESANPFGKKKKCKSCGNVFVLSEATQIVPHGSVNERQPSQSAQKQPRESAGKKPDRVLRSRKKELSGSLMTNMLNAGRYPFTGIVQFVAMFLALCAFFFTFTYGSLLCLLPLGFIVTYLFEVLRFSASGRATFPSFIPEDGIGELLLNACRIVGIILVCSLPAILYLKLVDSPNPGITRHLSFLGMFVFPMAITAVALHGSMSALHPIVLLAPLKKLFAQYLGICLVFFGLVELAVVAISHCQGSAILLNIAAGSFFIIYFSILAMHLLGMFYFRYRDDFGWFKPEQAVESESIVTAGAGIGKYVVFILIVPVLLIPVVKQSYKYKRAHGLTAKQIEQKRQDEETIRKLEETWKQKQQKIQSDNTALAKKFIEQSKFREAREILEFARNPRLPAEEVQEAFKQLRDAERKKQQQVIAADIPKAEKLIEQGKYREAREVLELRIETSALLDLPGLEIETLLERTGKDPQGPDVLSWEITREDERFLTETAESGIYVTDAAARAELLEKDLGLYKKILRDVKTVAEKCYQRDSAAVPRKLKDILYSKAVYATTRKMKVFYASPNQQVNPLLEEFFCSTMRNQCQELNIPSEYWPGGKPYAPEPEKKIETGKSEAEKQPEPSPEVPPGYSYVVFIMACMAIFVIYFVVMSLMMGGYTHLQGSVFICLGIAALYVFSDPAKINMTGWILLFQHVIMYLRAYGGLPLWKRQNPTLVNPKDAEEP